MSTDTVSISRKHLDVLLQHFDHPPGRVESLSFLTAPASVDAYRHLRDEFYRLEHERLTQEVAQKGQEHRAAEKQLRDIERIHREATSGQPDWVRTLNRF